MTGGNFDCGSLHLPAKPFTFMPKYVANDPIVLVADDPLRWSLGITRVTLEILCREKAPWDLIAVWIYYGYVARWQKSETAKATVPFLCDRLGLSAPRVRSARNMLRKLQLIEDCNAVDERGNVTHWCVKVYHRAHVDQLRTGLTFHYDDKEHWSVGITTQTLERLLKEEHFAELVTVWLFYANAARYQDNQRVFCSVSFVCKGLSMSEERVQRSRRMLKKLNLIEDYAPHDATGRVPKWYVKINYLTRGITIVGSPAEIVPCGKSAYKSPRTVHINTKVQIRRTSPEPPPPDPSGILEFSNTSNAGPGFGPAIRNDIPYVLRSNYQFRMGDRISRNRQVPAAWLKIAVNAKALCDDPWEFMDALFLVLDSSSYPARPTPSGHGPWPNQMQKFEWCQRAWQQRIDSFSSCAGSEHEHPGQTEWRMMKKMEISAINQRFGHHDFSAPEVIEHLRDSMNSIPPITRCALSQNDPQIVEEYGKDAAAWLRKRHAVARSILSDGHPLPPQFQLPPQFRLSRKKKSPTSQTQSNLT